MFKLPASCVCAAGSAMRRRLGVAAFMAATLLMAVGATGCNRSASADGSGTKGRGRQAAAKTPVTVQAVTTHALQRTIEVVGTLYGNEEATISAKVPGRIAQIACDVGDRIAPDDVLAQIEQRDYELACNAARLAVDEQLAKLGLRQMPQHDFDPALVPVVVMAQLQADNAHAKFERGKQLHDQTPPLMSDQDFADLQTAWAVARSNFDVQRLTAESTLEQARSRQADLEAAQQRLADTAVRAPSPSGSTSQPATAAPGGAPSATQYAVAARYISQGEYVREGTPLFRVIDDDPVKLRAAVPERYASQIQLGQAVRVTVEAYPDQTFDGRVSRLNPQVDLASRTFQIEVLLGNDRHLLKSGSFARGSILTRLDPRIVFVPLEAVVSSAGTDKVFVVDRDSKAKDIEVELGQRVGDDVEVIRGLDGSESVVMTGQSKLGRGIPVVVRTAAELDGLASSGANGDAVANGDTDADDTDGSGGSGGSGGAATTRGAVEIQP